MADDKNTITAVTNGEVLLLSFKEEECHDVDSCIKWVVDSVVSYHVTPNKEFFTMYKAPETLAK